MISTCARFVGRAILVAIASAGLAACVSSKEPLLGDSKPLFGERPRFALYGLRDGAAHDPVRASYRWNGSHYIRTSGPRDFISFTVHPFVGRDLILQSAARRNKTERIEYALARKLADGIYLLIAIDEDDADAATRDKFCIKTASASCEAQTLEHLLALARATADKATDQGGLAILLAPR